MAYLTITVPDTAVMRIRNVVAAIRGVPAPAPLSAVDDQVREYLRGLCVQVEQQNRAAGIPAAATAAINADWP